MLMLEINPAAAAVQRLLAARAAYDKTSRDPNDYLLDRDNELDNAVTSLCAYRCKSLADLAEYAKALWAYTAAERAETVAYGDDATAPLWEFWPIAAAVQRETERLLPA